jgi:hypothetical protein
VDLNVGYPEQYVRKPAGTGATAPVEQVIGAVQHAGEQELLKGGAHIVTFRNNLNKASASGGWTSMMISDQAITLNERNIVQSMAEGRPFERN